MGLRETETKKTETRWYHADKRPSIAKGKQKNKGGSPKSQNLDHRKPQTALVLQCTTGQTQGLMQM